MNKIKLLFLVAISVILLSSCIVTTGISALGTLSSVQNDRRSAGEIIDDETLTLFLGNWAYNNKTLQGADINFLVYNKTVLLTGEAPSKKVKKDIEQAMKKARQDIALVYNEIAVMPNSKFISKLKDNKIKLVIELSFYDQEVFYPGHIFIRVERGIVYLMGAVTKREANKAVKVASQAKGVFKIIKVFEYLQNRPQREIQRDKERQQEADRRANIDKKRAQLEAQKLKLQQEINKLEEQGN